MRRERSCGSRRHRLLGVIDGARCARKSPPPGSTSMATRIASPTSIRISIVMASAWIGLLVGSIPAAADSTVEEAEATWSRSVQQATATVQLDPEIERGRSLYTVCAACHLANGAGHSDGTMPQLAGQHRSVLIKQMMDIRSGLRSNPAMAPYLAPLEEPQQLADVAAYIEGLPVPTDNGKGPGRALGRGKKLYRDHCASCHGASGEGAAEAFYPALQAQHYRYVVRQLIDIAGARRGNAHPAMVEAIAGFTARDVADVADYVSRLGPRDTRESVGSP